MSFGFGPGRGGGFPNIASVSPELTVKFIFFKSLASFYDYLINHFF